MGAGQPSPGASEITSRGWFPFHSCVGPALGIDFQLVLFLVEVNLNRVKISQRIGLKKHAPPSGPGRDV